MNKRTQENAAFVILFIGIALVLGSMILTPIGGFNEESQYHKDIYFQCFSTGLVISYCGAICIWLVNRK